MTTPSTVMESSTVSTAAMVIVVAAQRAEAQKKNLNLPIAAPQLVAYHLAILQSDHDASSCRPSHGRGWPSTPWCPSG